MVGEELRTAEAVIMNDMQAMQEGSTPYVIGSDRREAGRPTAKAEDVRAQR